jgi:nuclear GTP-binding protein
MKDCLQQLIKIVEVSDVVIEVIDARDPLGCRNEDMEMLVKDDPKKKLIIVVNKVDLVPE